MGFLEALKEALKQEFGKRGAPKGAKEIDFAEIERIINYDEKTTDSLRPSEYVKWVNNEIDKLGEKLGISLGNNIFAEEEKGGNSASLYIKNFNFLIEGKHNILFRPLLFSMHYTFSNNTFVNNNNSTNRITTKIFEGFIIFEFNKFENIDLFVQTGDDKFASDVRIVSNEIHNIEFQEHANIYFEGENEIKDLSIFEGNKEETGAMWAPYQKLDITKFNSKLVRESFMLLKARAAKRNDKLQETLIDREILRCDSAFFYSKDANPSLQDMLILLFGKFISDHGVSWMRPLSLIFLFNAIFASIIFSIQNFSCDIDFWIIFAAMLNPINNLSDTLESLNNNGSICYKGIFYYLAENDNSFENLSNGVKEFWVLFISAIQKAIYALLVYEMIRVGRRFTPK